MSKITSIFAGEVLDSRGHPTLWVRVVLDDQFSGEVAVPSGASKGVNEALEKRDMSEDRYRGRGVLQAVQIVKQVICQALAKGEVNSVEDVDRCLLEMGKSDLGANSTVGVSIAAAKAFAAKEGKDLYQFLARGRKDFSIPVPLVNVINGGRHANNPLMVQEFMIMPHGFSSFREAIRCACEVFYVLGDQMVGGVGDEGGYAPDLETPEEVLDILASSVVKAGYKVGSQVSFALDVAASELFQDGLYQIDRGRKLSSVEMISFYQELCSRYPIVSIEDPLDQEDWDGWALMTQSTAAQIVGDDIFCTQKVLLEKGIKEGCANAILIKPNQVGTLTETMETIECAKDNGYSIVISHRSGETEDVTISDFAVATDASQIKAGSVCRSERVAKYNRLLRIEEELGSRSIYGGKS